MMRLNMNTLPGITIGVLEVENRKASAFMEKEENYNEMLKVASCMKGVDFTKATDLVHDVYMSILKDEENGEGFEEVRDGVLRDVAEFVYGRLKGYSKNAKYRVSAVETEVPACGAYSDDDGNLAICTMEQYEYAMAYYYDDLEAVEERLAFSEELNYFMTFQNQVHIDLKMFLQNIGKFAEMQYDKTILADIKNLLYRSADFAEAIKSVLKMYACDKKAYERAVAVL